MDRSISASIRTRFQNLLLLEMGGYAAVINSIPTDGFGSNFDWTNLQNNSTWESYLQDEFDLEKRLQIWQRMEWLETRCCRSSSES